MAKALVLALAPSLHVDESYYIGAARKILSGDFLLTTFAFDKLFLPPFVLTPGILLWGENVLGFRFSGLLLLAASFVVLEKLFVEYYRRTHASPTHMIHHVLATVSAFAFLALPTVLQHEASAMTEPALVFFLSLSALFLVRKPSSGAWAVPWTLAAFAKMSAVMWLPLFLFAELFIANERPGALPQKYWKRTKWWWLAAAVFMLFNRKKFAALTWFSHLGKNQNQPTGFLQRTSFWLETVQSQAFGFGGVLLLAMVITAVASVLFFRRDKSNTANLWIFAAAISPILHFVGLPLSGAPLYERYAITIWPLIILGLIGTHAVAKQSGRRIGKFATVALSSLVVVLGLLAARAQSLPLEPNVIGRVFEQAAQIIPSGARVFSSLLWELYPYESPDWLREMCENSDCVGRKSPWRNSKVSYKISRNDSGAIAFTSDDLLDSNGAHCEAEQVEIPSVTLTSTIVDSLRSELRLKNPGSIADLNVDKLTAGEKKISLIQDFGVGLGSHFRISDKNFELEVSGIFTVIPSFDQRVSETDPGLVFVVQNVTSVKPYRLDLTDVLALVWKKRVLRISRLNMPETVQPKSHLALRGLDIGSNAASVSVQQCR